MLSRLQAIIHHGFEKKIDAIGFDVFRITYHIVLLIEVVDLYRFRHLAYDAVPYVSAGDINIPFLPNLWVAVLCMAILGFLHGLLWWLTILWSCA